MESEIQPLTVEPSAAKAATETKDISESVTAAIFFMSFSPMDFEDENLRTIRATVRMRQPAAFWQAAAWVPLRITG
jgi:hypothetical protein